MPLFCRTRNIDALRADGDQLWAEAFARYSGDAPVVEVEKLAKIERESRQSVNEWEEHVDRFMTYLPPDGVRDRDGKRSASVEQVTTDEIFAAITGL